METQADNRGEQAHRRSESNECLCRSACERECGKGKVISAFARLVQHTGLVRVNRDIAIGNRAKVA